MWIWTWISDVATYMTQPNRPGRDIVISPRSPPAASLVIACLSAPRPGAGGGVELWMWAVLRVAYVQLCIVPTIRLGVPLCVRAGHHSVCSESYLFWVGREGGSSGPCAHVVERAALRPARVHQTFRPTYCTRRLAVRIHHYHPCF